ncbi:hypothetical protein D9756_005372 [Leucocoprinus leucothites]|uniref:Haloacid dehalogenase-like hydrolase domain-containing protein 3 n=1 Tax=Leucocoprinus leucothites TaxID=201217 RepID=A0A8H5D9C9_9AGAR|nr:hypothetical protein D9756_005372 [Leucoagaricus leucothites]
MAIRLVTFDALHTIITPRRPIHVQYAEVFAPFLGALDPNAIKRSFKAALKEVQIESPAYVQGADAWWGEVIRRTALSAGADERGEDTGKSTTSKTIDFRLSNGTPVLDASIHKIVPKLLKRFSSGEGYAAFEDAIPTSGYTFMFSLYTGVRISCQHQVQRLHDELGVATAVVSNGDSRIRSVIQDLGFPSYLSPIILSEEEGIEKPSREIFERALTLAANAEVPLKPAACLHVGDELICDFQGALEVGIHGLLLRRTGPDGEQAHKEPDESLDGVEVIEDLNEVVSFVKAKNSS